MSIYIRDPQNGIYWMRFKVQGRSLHESTGFADRARAQEAHDRRRLQLLDEARLGRKPDRAWEDAAGEWLVQHAHKRTLAKDQEIIRWLHPWLSGKRLSEIDRDLLEKIRRAKIKASSPSTANRYMALVRAILRSAWRDWGWIDSIPRIGMSRVDNARLVTISREKAEELLAELPPHLAAMARFTLETGLRRHNVTHLRWEQVDLERRLLWIPGEKTKNGKPLGVPLSEAATQVLMQQKGNHREYVFIYQDGPVYQTSTRAFKTAAKRAGLPADFRWHDLRHVWASWLAQDGTPILALQELGGWQSEAMVRRYAHFSVEHLRLYVDRSTEEGGAQKAYRPKLRVVKGGVSA
jgi:integrase